MAQLPAFKLERYGGLKPRVAAREMTLRKDFQPPMSFHGLVTTLHHMCDETAEQL